jgi:cytosine/adenosine deaminase-related metal-dependent hydrolase
MADLIIAHGRVVTMNADRTVYLDGTVVVSEKRIVEVGPSREILPRYTGRPLIDASGMLVIPGLIDAHNHPNQYLSRGIGDDVDVMTWLTKRVFPYETHLSEEEAYIGALANFAEMIQFGTTCFNEPGGYFSDAVGEAARAIGIRGILNRSTRDVSEPGVPAPPKLFETVEQNLRGGEAIVKKWNGAEGGRIRAWYSLRHSFSVSDELARGIRDLARAAGVGVHIHAAVGDFENELALERFGKRSLERLYDLELFGPNLYLVHMGSVNDRELDWLKQHDVKVSHCPSASMFGSYGVIQAKRIPAMVAKGITVSLGTDSATAGRFLDMVRCMYLAACAHKDAYGDPNVMGAFKALEMATTDGARACLWDDEIGSLEPGKLADITIIDTRGHDWTACRDTVRNLVYAANGTSVDTVIVDGRVLMRHRTLLTVDALWLKSEANRAAQGLIERAGIKPEMPWPEIR